MFLLCFHLYFEIKLYVSWIPWFFCFVLNLFFLLSKSLVMLMLMDEGLALYIGKIIF